MSLKAAISLTAAVVIGGTTATLLAQHASAAVSTPTIPSGHLDAVTVTAAGPVLVRGWAADANTDAPVRIAVNLDGGVLVSVLANTRRDDVARALPTLGALHGFSLTIRVPAGAHSVCVDVPNVGGGSNRRLGCRTVTIAGKAVKPAPPAPTQAPYGRLDSAKYQRGLFGFSGWSIDPDTTAPTLVDLTANGAVLGSIVANWPRPDVARAHPAFGAAHGVRAGVPAPTVPGNYLVCATAVNTAAGRSTLLGCRIVTVPPPSEPLELGTATAATAAAALQAQAIASGAARATDFPSTSSSAARIAIAARALLQQAAGLRPPPAAPTSRSIPPFVRVTPARPVDEQAVMGPTPKLGTYPAARTGGRSGVSHAVELFANDPRPLPSGAGDGLVGAAPVLPANGTTVRPVVPSYPAKYRKLRAEAAVDAALSQLGVPYVWAAAGPDSFDCSGFTMWAYANAGIDLYHYTVAQSVQGVRVKPNQLLPGDLLLFGGSLHHVGMYLGAGYMIDAPYTGSYVRINKVASYGDFTLAVRP